MTARARHPSYYDILQVAPDAPAQEIRAAYRRMAQCYHPARSPDNRFAPKVMANVNKAYAVLSDPARRQEHDRWLQRQCDGHSPNGSRMSRPSPLPELVQTTTRWPWYLLFATITLSVIAVGLVVFKAEIAGKPGLMRTLQR